MKTPMKYMGKEGRRSGYSLVEVTLALLVVAIGLVSTFALFPVGLKATRDAVDDTEIGLFAEYVFTTLELTAGLEGVGWTIGDTDRFKSSALARKSKVPNQSKFQLEDGGVRAVFYWIPDFYGLNTSGETSSTTMDSKEFEKAAFWTSAFTYELTLKDSDWKGIQGSMATKYAVLKVWPGEFLTVAPSGKPRIFYREILPFR